jgi:hypothetical protein
MIVLSTQVNAWNRTTLARNHSDTLTDLMVRVVAALDGCIYRASGHIHSCRTPSATVARTGVHASTRVEVADVKPVVEGCAGAWTEDDYVVNRGREQWVHEGEAVVVEAAVADCNRVVKRRK